MWGCHNYLEKQLKALASRPLSALLSSVDVLRLGMEELSRVQAAAREAEGKCAREQVRRELQLEMTRAALEQRLCSICMCRDVNMAFNCGHQVCGQCGDKLLDCHVCRVPIALELG